jgi:broad specificity phosphatase PhoE
MMTLNKLLITELEEVATNLDAAKRWLDDVKLFNAANSVAASAERIRKVIKNVERKDKASDILTTSHGEFE